MNEILKILFVEDVFRDAELIWHEIEKGNLQFEKLLVDNRGDYINSLDTFKPDLIISDYTFPHFDGMTALLLRNEKVPLTPFIIVTGSINEEVAVDCMKAGADDYILKDNLSRLGQTVVNSINKIKLVKEKKAAEDELRKSELRLQKAQSMAHVGNWELDLSTQIVLVSDEALRIYGFDKMSNEIPFELIKKSFLPECSAMANETLDNLLLYNELYEIEYKIKRANDGIIRYLHSKAECILIDNDIQIKIIGVIQDITEQKLAEEALCLGERRYRNIFENIQDVYYETSIDGKILDVSPSIGIVSRGQYCQSDLIGKSMYEFYTDPEERQAIMAALKGSGSVPDFEIKLKNGDGSSVPCSISAKLIFDAQGRPEKIIGSMRDISVRKKVEGELIRAKDKAEESDRLKTAFLHNISHEIRTPMNAIVGFSTLLGEPDIDASSRQSYIELIMQSSNHLLAIITDIVDIANIEANLIKISKNEINVNSTLKTLCDQFRLRADEKKLSLTCENALENYDAYILTDSTKLSQVLSNLISNALKFTNDGEIKVNYKVKDNLLEFSVSDTGIGIPGEHHERIFDRFYQVQNAVSRLYEGTGLGLAISKAYVELLGGKMWLASEPGKGTTFFFTIPYEKRVVEHVAVQEKRTPEGFVFPVRKTILVAEDVDSNFKLIAYFLSGANTNIIRAANGKEAVEKALNGGGIDLILMDIKMPVMDGYTAVKLIREANPTIPIVAQTAYADDRFRAIECGCNGFISKPFDKKGLLKELSDFV